MPIRYEKYHRQPKVKIDASALILLLLRRLKHELLLGAKDGSNIVACSLRSLTLLHVAYVDM